jgi:replicative DNA helicase
MPQPNPINEAERAVLCVLLNDSHAIIPVMDVLEDPDLFSLPLHAKVYGAILALTRAATLPNVYTVADKSGIPVADLQAMAAGFNTKLSREIVYTADIIRKDAYYRRVRDAAAQVSELANVKTDDPQGLAVVCAEMLMGSADTKNESSPSIGEVSKRFDVEVAGIADGDAGISLGSKLDWLQGKTAGFRPGHIWVIAAPYKGRKTTLMRNLIIGPCRAGASVDLFALEGTDNGTYAGLVAMLATERLLSRGYVTEAILSETFVLRGTRSSSIQDAISQARAEIDGWNLRVYDGRRGITQPDRLAHFIKRDRIIHGLNIFAVDYLQLLGDGKLFERMEASTHLLQRIAVESGLTAILLVQQNEATIGQAADNYSPGVKGGGDAAAAADFLIRTKYNGEATPDTLTVQLKLARHARPGAQSYRINAQSGLIVSPYGRAEEE